MDDTDRAVLALLREDATLSYAALGAQVGLSAAAAHERVRKLRERGVIRRTTIDIDPVALGLDVLAFVLVDSSAWVGSPATADALRALPAVEEAHIVAGRASLLLKVRTAGTRELQGVLREVHEIAGVSGTNAIVVLETCFERSADPGSV
ncbi:Lrp/AsnC family transcriptional regulator [Saccharothrix variisporea]|uniref:DNA-binding Lrp family transcriptional regulator n=1 Tax=Saccharothrix variisporea TaxID=543527 RepID=A0A495X3K7_9PSEU|nr:Lrp/AsnC family transcriptional regulator [Saccharothrix variisporea]RKT67203.1 DNA-binding Lrp family transcriptional regulator [Saccharothrix variisporea]